MPSLALSTRWRKRASLWSERFLDVPALGDVARRDRDAIVDADGLVADPALLAAFVLDLHLVLERFAGLDDLGELVEQVRCRGASAARRTTRRPTRSSRDAAKQGLAALVQLDEAEVDDRSARSSRTLSQRKNASRLAAIAPRNRFSRTLSVAASLPPGDKLTE